MLGTTGLTEHTAQSSRLFLVLPGSVPSGDIVRVKCTVHTCFVEYPFLQKLFLKSIKETGELQTKIKCHVFRDHTYTKISIQ